MNPKFSSMNFMEIKVYNLKRINICLRISQCIILCLISAKPLAKNMREMIIYFSLDVLFTDSIIQYVPELNGARL